MIRTNAPSARSWSEEGRATGVALANGDEIRAASSPAISTRAARFCKPWTRRIFRRLSGRHPQVPLRGHVAQDEPGADRSARIQIAYPGAPGPQHRATMHICPSVEYIERAWDDAKYGRPSQSPLIEMTIPTMYDPTLAPEGRHIMGIFLQYAPYTLQGHQLGRERDPLHRAHSRRDRRILPQHPLHHRAQPDADAARSGAPLRHHRRQYFSWRDVARPDVRAAAPGRLGELPDAGSRPVSYAGPERIPEAA